MRRNDKDIHTQKGPMGKTRWCYRGGYQSKGAMVLDGDSDSRHVPMGSIPKKNG